LTEGETAERGIPADSRTNTRKPEEDKSKGEKPFKKKKKKEKSTTAAL
jgi:hypothetical protein